MNASKKKDVSIPKKARPKEAVLKVSKLEKKMAMTSQRVISSKSEYPEGMSREEVLRREKPLKSPKEIEEEKGMQKRVKRDCKRVVRFEDFDHE